MIDTDRIRKHIRQELKAPIVGKISNDEEYWYLTGQCMNFLAKKYCIAEEVFLYDELLKAMMKYTSSALLFKDAMFTFLVESLPYIRNTDVGFYSSYAMLITYDLDSEDVDVDAILQGWKGKSVITKI